MFGRRSLTTVLAVKSHHLEERKHAREAQGANLSFVFCPSFDVERNLLGATHTSLFPRSLPHAAHPPRLGVSLRDSSRWIPHTWAQETTTNPTILRFPRSDDLRVTPL
jgi:hypothetical protein